jgi:hypothetical protein
VTAVALLPMDLVVAQVSALPAGASQELRNTHELPMVAEPAAWLPEEAGPRVRGQARPALSVVPNGDSPPLLRPAERPKVHLADKSEMSASGELREAAPFAAFGMLPVEAEAPRPTPGGLPKRVRQQSLAPQLQHDETVVIAAEEDGDGPVGGRSPEQLRRMMSSFQAGTARGRHEAGVDGDGDGEQR